jgi:hypothetical protein
MPRSSEAPELPGGTAAQRAALVLAVLRGTTTADAAATTAGVTVAEFDRWTARFLRGAENGLQSHPRSQVVLREREIQRLQRIVDSLALDLQLYKDATSLVRTRREQGD